VLFFDWGMEGMWVMYGWVGGEQGLGFECGFGAGTGSVPSGRGRTHD